MTTIIRTEQRKRGILGWLFLGVFIAFNILMLIGLLGGARDVAAIAPAGGPERAGHVIGATLGIGMLLGLWVLGDIILGAFVLLTRGRKVVVEERRD